MPTPSFNEWKVVNPGKGLNEYFEAYPEARLKANQGQPIIVNQNYKKESNISYSIIWILLAVAVIGGGVAYGVNTYQNTKVLERNKQNEVRYPAQYLKVSDVDAKTGFFRKTSVTGWIKNNSTYTIYSDVILLFQFTDNDSNISEEKITVDMESYPGGNDRFDIEIKFPNNPEGYKITVLGARVIGQDGVSSRRPWIRTYD